MNNYIDFDDASELTKAVSWVFQPDTDLTASCALRHIYLKQIDGNNCALLGYAAGDVWLYKKCPAQGIIGIEFLFDGEDMLKVLSKKNGFKDCSLRISGTKETKIKLEAVLRIVEDKLDSAGNIMVPTYGGEISDFEIPEEDWQLFGSIEEGYEFKNLCRIVSEFSGLKASNNKQPVWFRLGGGHLACTTTERGGDRGNSMMAYVMPNNSKELRVGIQGKYLTKTSEIFGSDKSIKIYLDNLEEPERIKFEGDMGWISLPIVDAYHCQALSRGSMNFFFHEEQELEVVCERSFNLPQLERGIALQTIRNEKRKDRLLEMIQEKLVITKRNDILRKELSQVPTWDLDGKGEWVPLVADHFYLENALEALDKHLSYCIKQERDNYVATSFEELEEDNFGDLIDLDDEELETDKKTFRHRIVTLTEKKLTYEDGFEEWFLFIDSPRYVNCKAMIICSSVEATADFVEED